MSDTRKKELGVGLLVLFAAALLAWMSLQLGALGGLRDRLTVSAVFRDVTGLQEGAAVTVAGVEVGQVGSLQVRGERAEVQLFIDAAAELPAAVQPRVRARSLLGEKYVELKLLSLEGPRLAEGALLEDTRSQVEITDLVTRLEPLLVILEESDIGGLVEQLSEGLEKDPELFSRMLQDGEAALSALREASEQGPALVTEGRETLQQLRSSLSQVQPLLQRAEGISEDLELAAEDLPGLTEQADPLLEDLRAVTAEIRALTAQLGARDQQIGTILDNLEEIDKWELRRLLREEGIKVRIKEQEVIPSE